MAENNIDLVSAKKLVEHLEYEISLANRVGDNRMSTMLESVLRRAKKDLERIQKEIV